MSRNIVKSTVPQAISPRTADFFYAIMRMVMAREKFRKLNKTLDLLNMSRYTIFKFLNREVNRLGDMIFDYSEIRKAIHDRFGTEEEFAKAIGLGRVSLSQKFNNAYDFTRIQMVNILNALELPVSDIDRYFFKLKVQEVRQEQSDDTR